jgi:hypothetical protein
MKLTSSPSTVEKNVRRMTGHRTKQCASHHISKRHGNPPGSGKVGCRLSWEVLQLDTGVSRVSYSGGMTGRLLENLAIVCHWMIADLYSYMRREDFTSIQRDTGMSMKEPHTIIEKWPCMLRLKAFQVGGKQEFRTLLGASTNGSERYVEWKRTI